MPWRLKTPRSVGDLVSVAVVSQTPAGPPVAMATAVSAVLVVNATNGPVSASPSLAVARWESAPRAHFAWKRQNAHGKNQLCRVVGVRVLSVGHPVGVVPRGDPGRVDSDPDLLAVLVEQALCQLGVRAVEVSLQ